MSTRLVTEKTVITLMRSAIDEYLKETTFGLSSGYKHGETGRLRAERLKAILLLDSIWMTGMPIWPLLLAVYQAAGQGLRTCLTTRIAYTSGFGEKLYPLIKENRGKGYTEIECQERAIKTFIEDRLSQPVDERIEKVVAYLNGEGEFKDIKPVIETLNLPKKEEKK
jgi:hypothetical protein